MSQTIAPRACGCFGIGRHRNSCPEKILTSSGTIPPVQQTEQPRIDAPPPVASAVLGRPQEPVSVPAVAPQSSVVNHFGLTGEPVQVPVWSGPKDASALAVNPNGPLPLQNIGAPPPSVPTWYGLPCMPDEEMENYGGDLAAHESYSTKSRRPMATIRSSMTAARTQPDLNYKGLLVNRHDPAKRFHFAYLLEDGSQNYQQAMQVLRQRGYRPVTPADFYVHSSLRDGAFVSDDATATGRLTLGGALKGGATVIYAQDEPNYNRWRAYDRRFSDQIQLTADEQAARTQEALASDGFAGILATATFE